MLGHIINQTLQRSSAALPSSGSAALMPDPESSADLGLLIFSRTGLAEFVRQWNASEFQNRLARLGSVQFECVGAEASPVFLFWDSAGRVTLEHRGPVTAAFAATSAAWSEFFRGNRPASALILAGRIRFAGRLRDIAPYSLAFNCLPIVAERAIQNWSNRR